MAWELRVDGLLLPVAEHEFTDPLSGVGSGKATVNADDSRWSDHLDKLESDVLWVASYDSVDRFAWIGEDYSESMVDGGGVRVEVSGRGIAAELERAILLPAGYPDQTSRERKMTDTPMGIWLTLLSEAQGRGALSGWSTTFTDSADSDGTSWSKTFDFESGPGANLLDLLKRLADAEQCEWRARPDRTLDAWKSPGSDLSGSVRWYVTQQTDRQAASEEVDRGRPA